MAVSPMRPATLADLAQVLGGTLPAGTRVDTVVRGLADDSRGVSEGFVFFARRGSISDGTQYARDAVDRGAVLVIAENDLETSIPVLVVPDAARALRDAADAWYGRPQDALDLIGITGTKGKTTTAWLAASALRGAGLPTAILGTIAHDFGDGQREPAANTTPGVLELRRLLARARDAGSSAVVMEVSSHALDQERVAGLQFRVGVLTNLASDHLDYHETPEAYFAAKARLFDSLASSATALLNLEDPSWTRFAARCRGSVLTYGATPEADLSASRVALSVERSHFHVRVGESVEVEAQSAMIGRHNVRNILAAVGVAVALGVDPVHAVEGACALDGVPGRLQRVTYGDDLYAFIDYAHTEDALLQVLSFLRGVGAQPLTCVIGCGGDRDTTKRPRMGRVAAELADRAIFTSDNPRTEDPEAILAAMAAGATEPQLVERVTQVVDRREAIHRAVLDAEPGSTVLVAGKGHETYQIVGADKRPFDDQAVVREALEARERARQAAPDRGPPDRGSPPA